MENKTRIILLLLAAAAFSILVYPTLKPTEATNTLQQTPNQIEFPHKTNLSTQLEAPQLKPLCPDCNVILISIDTLRADHVGAYGYYRNTTPNIDRLARQGILFKNAHSPAPWTLPSHATMLSGLELGSHGAVYQNSTLSEELLLLAERFKEKQYESAAFVSGGFLDKRYGFDQGFDVYESNGDDFEVSSERAQLYTNETNTFYTNGSNTFEKAIQWVKSPQGKFFLFVHTYQVHDYMNLDDRTFINEPEYRKYGEHFDDTKRRTKFMQEYAAINLTPAARQEMGFLEDKYDSALHDVDRQVQALVDELTRLGLMNRTIIILTSDHGEEFGDHARLAHANKLYEEMLRVPLIMILPGSEARVEVSPVGLVDIAPTVTYLLGINQAGMDGGNLLMPDPRRILIGGVDWTVSRSSLLEDKKKLIHTSKEILRIQDMTNPKVTGFYQIESNGNITYSWTGGNSTMVFKNLPDGEAVIDIGVRRWRPDNWTPMFLLNGKPVNVTSKDLGDLTIYSITQTVKSGNINLSIEISPWTPEGMSISSDVRQLGIPLRWVNVTTNNKTKQLIPENVTTAGPFDGVWALESDEAGYFVWTKNETVIRMPWLQPKELVTLDIGVADFRPTDPNLTILAGSMKIGHNTTTNNQGIIYRASFPVPEDRTVKLDMDTWVPEEGMTSDDDRELGIAVDWVRVRSSKYSDQTIQSLFLEFNGYDTDRLSGFFPPEINNNISFQWSAPETHINLSGLGYDAPLQAEININKWRPKGANASFSIGGETLPYTIRSGEDEVYSFIIPVKLLKEQILTVSISPFMPGRGDDRILGLPFDKAVFTRINTRRLDIGREDGDMPFSGTYGSEATQNITFKWTTEDATLDLQEFSGADLEVTFATLNLRPDKVEPSFTLCGQMINHSKTNLIDTTTYTVVLPATINCSILQLNVAGWKPAWETRTLGLSIDWIEITSSNNDWAYSDFPVTVDSDIYEYYDLEKDPGEQDNNITDYLKTADAKDKQLILSQIEQETKYAAQGQETVIIGAQLKEQLTALGYLV
jgi:hypothetical protein